MNIDFALTLEEYQKARKLHLVLEQINSSETDPAIRQLVDELNKQIQAFLEHPQLAEQFMLDHSAGTGFRVRTPLAFLTTIQNFLFGPSNRELTLSKQRRDLIARAEHAENIAYQALAESADLKKNLDEAIKKLGQLEKQGAL